MDKLFEEWQERHFKKGNDFFSRDGIVNNRVGKTAYIYSLVDGSILATDRGTFVKKGEYLTGTYKSSFLPFGANVADLKIKITEKMTYKIDDNSQVNENTVFA